MSLFYFYVDYLYMYQSLVLENKTQYYSEFLKDTIWNLLDTTYIIPSHFDYRIYIVSEDKYVARPDLISNEYYGDPMYADVICKINGISNPFELNKDMVLILPTPETVQDFIRKPSEREQETGVKNNETILPAPKSKVSKRKPNDAIIGDKRFKIDPARGIVMY